MNRCRLPGPRASRRLPGKPAPRHGPGVPARGLRHVAPRRARVPGPAVPATGRAVHEPGHGSLRSSGTRATVAERCGGRAVTPAVRSRSRVAMPPASWRISSGRLRPRRRTRPCPSEQQAVAHGADAGRTHAAGEHADLADGLAWGDLGHQPRTRSLAGSDRRSRPASGRGPAGRAHPQRRPAGTAIRRRGKSRSRVLMKVLRPTLAKVPGRAARHRAAAIASRCRSILFPRARSTFNFYGQSETVTLSDGARSCHPARWLIPSGRCPAGRDE